MSESIYERLQIDMTAAMKAKDADTLSTLRMLKAAILEAKTKKPKDAVITRDEEIEILQRYAKKRRPVKRTPKGDKDDKDSERDDLEDKQGDNLRELDSAEKGLASDQQRRVPDHNAGRDSARWRAADSQPFARAGLLHPRRLWADDGGRRRGSRGSAGPAEPAPSGRGRRDARPDDQPGAPGGGQATRGGGSGGRGSARGAGDDGWRS